MAVPQYLLGGLMQLGEEVHGYEFAEPGSKYEQSENKPKWGLHFSITAL